MNNLFSLNKKIIVLTGACGLLGSEFAYSLASYSATPVLIDIDNKKLKILEKAIFKKFNLKCMTIHADITNESQIIKATKRIMNKYKKINGLINNAARNPKIDKNKKIKSNALENFDISEWNKDIEVSLTGSFICSKHFGKEILKNKDGGSIINISSDLGLIGPDQRIYQTNNKVNFVKPISYSVSKSGLIGLTRYLATYWAEKNVRCNAICPGGIENKQSKKFISNVSNLIPLSRMAKSNEYQSTLIWMLSDSTKYLNGSIVSVDGGRTVW